MKLLTFLMIFSFSFSINENEIFEELNGKIKESKPENLTIFIAKQFLGNTYKAHTLEGKNQEELIVNLREFDCNTFVESVLALKLTFENKDNSFEKYKNNLQKIRYSNGQISGYSSRFHYLSAWIKNLEYLKILNTNTNKKIGQKFQKEINFMRYHWQLYPKINNIEQNKIINIEQELSKEDTYYIPKNEVEKHEKEINEGDIIAIKTNVKGLDFSHLGFAIKLNNRIHLLHASSKMGKVIISQKPLNEYLNDYKSDEGIVVCRIME